MRVKKINKVATELPKKSAFMIDTEPDFIKLHTLCIASGKRGGGKSVAIANLVKKAKEKGYYVGTVNGLGLGLHDNQKGVPKGKKAWTSFKRRK